MNTGTKMRL